MVSKVYKFYSEALIKRTVDTMVQTGYKAAGYDTVVIDDCWLEKERDPQTLKLVPDRERFPNGMKAVGDYVSWGKLGIIIHNPDLVQQLICFAPRRSTRKE